MQAAQNSEPKGTNESHADAKTKQNKWSISIVSSMWASFTLRARFQFDAMSYKSLFFVFLLVVRFVSLLISSFSFLPLVKLYEVFYFIRFYSTINLLVRHHCLLHRDMDASKVLQKLRQGSKVSNGQQRKMSQLALYNLYVSFGCIEKWKKTIVKKNGAVCAHTSFSSLVRIKSNEKC